MTTSNLGVGVVETQRQCCLSNTMFDSIPDFENLGYQVEIINIFEKFQRLH